METEEKTQAINTEQKPDGDPPWVMAKLDKAARKARKEVYERIEGELGVTLDELPQVREKLNALRDGEDEIKRYQRDLKKAQDEQQKLMARIGEFEKRERDFAVTTALQNAVGTKAIDPGDVVDLLRNKVVYNDGKVLVADDDKVDLTKFVDEFLEKKPHLKRAVNAAGGSGASPTHAAKTNETEDKTSDEWRRKTFSAVLGRK